MTEHQGSALPTFKAALVEALQALWPMVVRYDSPAQMAEVLGEDGSGIGVWWLDRTDVEYELNVVHRGALQFDEIATPTLVIQCIGVTTDDTQEVVDRRAADVQWAVFSILAGDTSTLVPNTADMQIGRATPSSAGIDTGIDSQNQRAARIELQILLEARITAS